LKPSNLCLNSPLAQVFTFVGVPLQPRPYCVCRAGLCIGISAYDIKKNGLNANNGSDVFVGVVSIATAPYGGWLIAPLFSICKWTTNQLIQPTPIQFIDAPMQQSPIPVYNPPSKY
jgi:hypothetical protein